MKEDKSFFPYVILAYDFEEDAYRCTVVYSGASPDEVLLDTEYAKGLVREILK